MENAYIGRIKFENKDWLIIENFIFAGKRYLYIVSDLDDGIKIIDNIEELNRYKDSIEMIFIEEVEKDVYKRVDNPFLRESLFYECGYQIEKSKIEG